MAEITDELDSSGKVRPPECVNLQARGFSAKEIHKRPKTEGIGIPRRTVPSVGLFHLFKQGGVVPGGTVVDRGHVVR